MTPGRRARHELRDTVDRVPLVVGIPREIKTDEHRVAITPDGVVEMTHRNVPVVIEAGAGVDSGIADDMYREAGAEIVDDMNRVALAQ